MNVISRLGVDALRLLLPPNSDLKTIKNCFVLLSKREIQKLKIISLSQLFLAFIDFAGVTAIGLIGTLSVYGIQSKEPSTQLTWILTSLRIESWSFQSQVALIGSLAGLLLISKSTISALINRRTIFFLSNRSAEFSIRILEKLTFSHLEQIKRRSRFENIYAIINGVHSITVGVIGTLVNLFADLALILVMFLGLMAIDASIAISTVFFFGIIAMLLYILVNKEISRLAAEDANLSIKRNQLLYELFGSFREIFAGGLRHKYVSRINSLSHESAKVSAKMAFVPSISKYVLEISFVIGSFLFVATQFFLKDAIGAISSISIFIASSGRIIPAILRIQTAALTFKGALSGASRTLEIIEELKQSSNEKLRIEVSSRDKTEFLPRVSLSNVSFRYEDSEKWALTKVNLDIKEGEWLAIIGPSGAGKTTLVDLILGILKPNSGEVKVSGIDAEEAVSIWSGLVSYVPQDAFLHQGTIAENVAFSEEQGQIDESRVVECIELVGLSDLINLDPRNINLEIGELGSRLSGGQRQRLGIARALYSKPKLLILDEATSALDSVSEKQIVDCLMHLKQSMTIISIAHRLTTVINADRVAYVNNAEILATGTFLDVSKSIPNLDLQAEIKSETQ